MLAPTTEPGVATQLGAPPGPPRRLQLPGFATATKHRDVVYHPRQPARAHRAPKRPTPLHLAHHQHQAFQSRLQVTRPPSVSTPSAAQAMQRLNINTATALTGATLPAGTELTARHQAQPGERAAKAINTSLTPKHVVRTASPPAHGVAREAAATSDRWAILAAPLGVATEATGGLST